MALHSYTHEYEQVYTSVNAYFEDLQKISDAVESIIGEKCDIIRFPGGSSNTISANYCKGLMTELTKQVEEKGYTYVDWNRFGRRHRNNVPVDKIMANIRNGGTKASNNGGSHARHRCKKTTAEALPQIIQFYRDAGYSFAGLTKDTPAVHHGVNN